jgi:CPA2 family monovalent cation:H+ antiporter-2
MDHEITLIATIAISLALASAFGFVAQRLRLPPLIGYLVAGMMVGHFLPADVADGALASQLAEIGIMLMMFGVGLHFSVADLLAVRKIAIPGAIGQIMFATVIGIGLGFAWGWSLGSGLVLGLSLSVASTVVLLRALDTRNALTTLNGRIAIGWLIVEDVAMVLALVLLPAMVEVLGGGTVQAGTHTVADPNLLATLGLTVAKVAGFIAIALTIGPLVLPWILREVARTGSRELFTLATLAIALGIAFGAALLFGVSFALGAFFAGMVLNKSELSHKAAANSLPLQEAFGVLFFISVGMLFDPTILIREPAMAAAVLGLILVGKSLAALSIVLLLGYPLSTALTVAAALSQIGEFSFILGGLGMAYGLIEATGFNLILAGALISIMLNPLMFAATDWARARLKTIPGLQRGFEEARAKALEDVQSALNAAREAAEQHAAAKKTFTPEELAEAFPLFAGLTAEQREVLILHFQPHTVEPGERIIRAGEPADALYLIAEGEVEVKIDGRKVGTRGPGEFFGEMALLSGDRRTADVNALDYSRFARLSRRDFHQFLRRYPSIREHIAELAAQRAESSRQVLAAQQPLQPNETN